MNEQNQQIRSAVIWAWLRVPMLAVALLFLGFVGGFIYSLTIDDAGTQGWGMIGSLYYAAVYFLYFVCLSILSTTIFFNFNEKVRGNPLLSVLSFFLFPALVWLYNIGSSLLTDYYRNAIFETYIPLGIYSGALVISYSIFRGQLRRIRNSVI